MLGFDQILTHVGQYAGFEQKVFIKKCPIAFNYEAFMYFQK